MEGEFFRIHPSRFKGGFFGKNMSGRFDDPQGQYGVLYASLRAEGAFAEVFLRNLSWQLIAELDLQLRSLTVFQCATLHCVDLTGAGLKKVGSDNRIATEKPYQTTGKWSRALFSHPGKPDGIIYRSRHNPNYKSVALFDRCQSRVKVKVSQELMSAALSRWTLKQIRKYDLALEPMP
jgi:hypothetical protein